MAPSQRLLLIGFLVTLTFQNGLAFLCPPAALLEPCTCDSTSTIICDDEDLSHQHLHSVFEMLRTVNLIRQFEYLEVDSFTLTNTNISSLDIRFLANHTSFNNLAITANPRLTNVILPSGSWPWRAQARNINLSHNGFLKSGLNPLFSLLGDSVESLDLSYNNIQGFTGREIVDGLPFLGQLEYLSLNNNFLTTLSSNSFYHNNRLATLDLSNNRINQVGQSTFEIERAPIDLLDVTLTIWLNGNQLTDGAISPDSKLATIGRPLKVHLENNNFVFVSAANFETSLYVNFNNILYFAGNNFICDQKMRWLKDARVILEERVLSVDCLNDPGYTIFTTDRV